MRKTYSINQVHYIERKCTVNDNGDYVFKIYYFRKVTVSGKVKAHLIKTRTWIVKKDGIAYNVFNKNLASLANNNFLASVGV